LLSARSRSGDALDDVEPVAGDGGKMFEVARKLLGERGPDDAAQARRGGARSGLGREFKKP